MAQKLLNFSKVRRYYLDPRKRATLSIRNTSEDLKQQPQEPMAEQLKPMTEEENKARIDDIKAKATTEPIQLPIPWQAIKYIQPLFNNALSISKEQRSTIDFINCGSYRQYVAVVVLNDELAVPSRHLYCNDKKSGEYVIDDELYDEWRVAGYTWQTNTFVKITTR